MKMINDGKIFNINKRISKQCLENDEKFKKYGS